MHFLLNLLSEIPLLHSLFTFLCQECLALSTKYLMLNTQFLSIIWNPNPIALKLSFLTFSWYGITWASSIVLGYYFVRYVFKREQKDLELSTNLVYYVFFGTMIGARIFDVLFYHWDMFVARPLLIVEIWNGGLSSHGAMLGAFLAIYLFTKRYKDFSFLWIVDRGAIIMPLLGALVRIGNFINSELYGKATTLPWGVIFFQTDPSLTPRHPVQIYEAIWLSLCFIIFFNLYKKGRYFSGMFFSLFFVVVLGGRFIIEFLKDSQTYFGPISNTQFLSLVAVFIGLTLFWIFYKKRDIANKITT